MCFGDTQVLCILPKINEKDTKAEKNSKNENKESEALEYTTDTQALLVTRQ